MPVPTIDGRLESGFAILKAIGPQDAPLLTIGDAVTLTFGLNGRSDTGNVETITSRSYGFRMSPGPRGGRSLYRVRFDEIRNGECTVSKISDTRASSDAGGG